MASSQKIVFFTICLLLVSCGITVEAGQFMMDLFGGGRRKSSGALEALLAAGILAKLLHKHRSHGHHGHGHHGHVHGHVYAAPQVYEHPHALPYAPFDHGVFGHRYGLF
ncbi:hypothetical protein X975_15438, partial [Stegodyphus mimosarum]